jgi:signal peptidase II
MALGYVVDFVSLHYRTWYWPAFNVADSAISMGAVLLVVDSFSPQKASPGETKGVADG